MKFNARTFIFIRENARLTKTEVAEKLALSRKTIEAWEQGKSSPNPRNLKALAELFQVEPDIFSYSDSAFYNYILQHVHPAEFPLVVRSLLCAYWELGKLPVADRVLKKCAIFDRLLPLMHQGHDATLDEPTEAQFADEELIYDASPYD